MDTEDTAKEAQQATEPVTPQSIAEVIAELEEYRERLLKDMTTVAKKAKLPKSKLEAELEPQLTKIDAALKDLRSQHATLTSN
ncbi:MAG: hypothetical protein F6K31_02160 [Symploca sp. SIO2G7]|nr:hypothetical protein [Symploca sp. SIO2G7]